MDSELDALERAPPNEETALVASSNAAVNEDDELERPWPATMDRSFALLASPVMDSNLVRKVTRSPKVTPYQVSLASRKKYRDTVSSLEPIKEFDRPTLIRMHSLDYSPNSGKGYTGISETKSTQEEAKAYRKSLLERTVTPAVSMAQKNKKSLSPSNRLLTPQEEILIRSPGYHREIATNKLREQLQEDNSGHSVGLVVEDKATFEQCMMNLANILMGVGMLALPYVFRRSGWLGGVFVTLTFSSVAWRTTILLGRELNGDPRPTAIFESTFSGTRMRKPISSFPDIARESFGQNVNLFLSSVLYFELFSCLCIFLVSIGDHLHMMIPSITMNRHMITVAALLTIPTALLRTPTLLSYLSTVGTFSTIAIVLSVLGKSLTEGDISEKVAERLPVKSVGPYHQLWDSSGLAISFGLIAYAFSGHAVVPSIYKSMKNPHEFERMVHKTFIAVIFSCLVVASSGYYMFGSTVDDQVTLSLEKSEAGRSYLMTLLTWLMILTAFSKFTLTAFPLALGLEEIVGKWVPSDEVMEVVSSLIKVCLIIFALLVAIFIPSFSFLCSLVGLVCTMIVSVIFPAAAHLKLFWSGLPLWEKVVDWCFIVAGIFMAIVGTFATV